MNIKISTPRQLGVELRAQRKLKKLTQIQTAENVGLQAKTISAMENDPSGTRVASLFKLLSALDMNLQLVSRGNENNNPSQSEW